MEVEAYLRPPEMEMPPYPAKVITLATGSKMVVRQAERDDVPTLLKAVKPTLEIERDKGGSFLRKSRCNSRLLHVAITPARLDAESCKIEKWLCL